MKLRYTVIGGFFSILVLSAVGAAIFKPPEKSVYRPVASEKPIHTKQVSATHRNTNYAYTLSFVEFNDDGFISEEKQKDSVVSQLEKLSSKDNLITLVYIHGWNHDASFDDENVACFEELVKATSIMQASYKTSVYGIYVGWPGKVYKNETLNTLFSFWGREATADRIAQRGDLLGLLGNISKIRHRSNSKRSKLVVIGHSLGGRTAYKTLSPIMQRYIDGDISNELIADLTIFANPAFSAEEHEHLSKLMRSPKTNPNRMPRFIIATSEDDEVLAGIYPWSMKFGSFFRGDYRLSNRSRVTPVGLYEGYLTHELSLKGNYQNPGGTGRCKTLVSEELEIIKAKQRVENEAELYSYEEIVHYDNARKETYRTNLRRIEGNERSSAMVVKVKDRIIPNHNDIFTSPFVDFISRVLNCEFHPACRKAHTHQINADANRR